MANVFAEGPSLVKLSLGTRKAARERYGLQTLEAVVAELKKLPEEISLKYQMQALRKASKPGQQALKSQVASLGQVTGNLLAAVDKGERKYTNNKQRLPVAVVVIGYRRPTNAKSQRGATPAFAGGSVLKGPNRGYHSHLVEYGTRPRSPGKSKSAGRKRVIVNGRINSVFLRVKQQATGKILSSFKSRGAFTGKGRGQYPKDFIATGTVAGSPARHPLKKAFEQSKPQMQSILDSEMRKALTRASREYVKKFGDAGGLL